MALDIIVKQHIDDLLVTSTLAGAQSTLEINTNVTTVVQANSSLWGEIDQVALNLKANRNNPSFTGLLSATGPVIIDVNTSMNALRITQVGSGPALLVEDNTNIDASPFIITSTGNVGIGKIPDAKLEVQSSNTITKFIGIGGTTDNGIAINNAFANAASFKLGYVDFRNENDIAVSRISGNINTNGSSDTVFYTTINGDRTTSRLSERMRITGSGRVGINNNNPAATLHVVGDIIGTGITSNGTIIANSLTLNQGQNSTLFIPTSARVQFGSIGDNTDNFYIQRVNPGEYFGGNSELRVSIGDDPSASGVNTPLSSTYVDRVSIGCIAYGTQAWISRINLESTGLVSSFGDYLPSNSNPLTATPSNPTKPEHLTTKKYVDQHRTPPGAIMTFAMSAAPTGWLYCNGQQVSRTTYSELFSAIGTTYGIGNGTTTFSLPDMRGEFVRGWDNSRGIDSGRAFGSTQKGTITIVDPNLNSLNVAGIYSEYEYNTSTFAPVAGYDIINIADYAGVLRAHIGGTGSGLLETNGFAQGATRPRNIALYYCIKH